MLVLFLSINFVIVQIYIYIPISFPKPSTWEGSDSDWMTVCNFLRGLRWHLQADRVTSLCEVTALFHQLGYKLVDLGSAPTYLDYHRKIRRAIVLLSRCDAVQATPGVLSASLAKAAGHTMPQGSIVGASLYADNDALVHLARIFEHGAGRTLASWDFSLL